MKKLTKPSTKKTKKLINNEAILRELEILMKRAYSYHLSINIKRGIALRKKRLQTEKF